MNLTIRIGAAVIILVYLVSSVWAQPGKKRGAQKVARYKQAAVASSLPNGVRTEEVKFESAEIKLAGTVWWPKLEAGRRAPVVLILVDGGATPRDGVTAGQAKHYTYRDLAAHLAGRGLAVFSFDKRCVGASECRSRATFEDRISDAQAAVAYLRSRPELDPARVAVFGHGEGGFIGAVVAAQDEKIAAVVLAASPGRTLGKLLREQAQRSFSELGRTEEELSAYLATLNRVLDQLQAGKIDFSEDKLDLNDPVLLGLVKQPELAISLIVNDPLQAFAAVRAPVLILQGEKDVQIGVRDAQYIEEALKRVHHPDFTLRLLPEVDHLLKTNRGAASFKSYQNAARPVDPALLSAVAEWLQKKLK